MQEFHIRMNNNYHTQMNNGDKKILNEIAASNQLLHQQNIQNKPMLTPQPIYQQAQQFFPMESQQNQVQQSDLDDIDLSEVKQEQKISQSELDQINKNIQKLENQITKHTPQEQQIVPRDRRLIQSYQHSIDKNDKKKSRTSEYIIISITLLIVFIILMHPSTNKYIGKFLPSLESTKGILIRGIILVIFYILVKFGFDKIKN